jgi:tetratricopeptide (TPR) repeat protein
MSAKKLIVMVATLATAFLVVGMLAPFERKAQTDSRDPAVLASEALVYLTQSRNEADPTLLREADALLERSLKLKPNENFEAHMGMASLSNARHDFSASVQWAQRAIQLNPFNASPHGLLGDALFELGRYAAADRAYQKMIDLRPNLASYVRASYALQFKGQTHRAIQAMKQALQAAGPVGETPAWIRHQIGDIYFTLGRLNETARQNAIGTRLAPGYVPPRVGLAEVAIARGRLNKAMHIVETAARRLPSLEYLIKLGDLYRATGRDAKAEEQYREVADRLALYRSNGVLPDVDFIHFYADHTLRPRKALEEARFVYRNRPTGSAADALAWLLHRQGRSQSAWRYARRALRSPVADGTFYLHAGIIARAVGRKSLSERFLRTARHRTRDLSILQLRDLRTLG